MRYVMRQDLFSFGDDFTIKDDTGRDAFVVDGKVFSIGNKLTFLDASSKQELARIEQKLIALSPKYEVIRDGRVAAVVQKQLFTLLRCKFTVDVPGPDDLEAKGNLLEHEYTFERGGRDVARVSKKWFTLRDTYGVDIDADQDAVLILASAVVIDMACHADKKAD
jgi:uncharacterized protein YxjI